MSNNIYTKNSVEFLTSYKNRSYSNNTTIPFKGHHLLTENVNDQRFMYIYKITCLKDQCVYIGQRVAAKSVKDPLKDRYKGSGFILKKLKDKYNWLSDFKFEIIKFCKDKQDLDNSEKHYIKLAREKYNDKCINIANGGDGGKFGYKDMIKGIKNSIAKTSKPVIIIFDFTSPLNGKSFKTGTIFKSTHDCAREIGYKSCTTIGSIINSYCNKPKGHWYNRSCKLITCILYYKEGMFENLTTIQKHELQKSKQYIKTHCKAKRTNNSYTHKVKVITTFTSPYNQTTFVAGTVFESVSQGSRLIGFADNNILSQKILNHKSHPGEWYNKHKEFIAKFEYV